MKALTKKSKLVKYKDSRGNHWETPVGEPTGAFRIQGSDKLFSTKDFAHWMERNIAIVSPDTGDSIEDAGIPKFEDFESMVGAPIKPETKGKAKAKAKDNEAEKKKQMVFDVVKKTKHTTKKNICQATGLGEVAVKTQLEKLIGEGSVKTVGKEKGSILYAKS